MVVADSQTTRSISGSGGGPITKSKNPADIQAANRFHHGVGSRLRGFEMHGNRLIAPWILELMASISDINKLHTELARGLFKAARLVTQLRGKEQQSFTRTISRGRQRLSIQTNDSVCGNDSLAWAKGTNWSRVGSAQQYQGSLR